MSHRLERGRLLLSQDRPALAETEFRAAVAEDPRDPYAHTLLALCLSAQGKGPAALAEAHEAVGLGPDAAFCHYALASVLDDLDRFAEAETSVREAIRLDPEDADPRSLLASLHVQRGRWAEGLAAADEGLALDPEHGGCANLRALALVQLGRRDEAASTIREALARDPEDATTHANRGWGLLHEGKPREALEHFREAMRLEPGHEWAREGIVEALKAKNLVYRWLLRWTLWMSRLSPRVQALVVVGAYVLYRGVAGLRRSHPEWGPYLTPLIWLYVCFACLTWVGDPVFDLLLRLDRFGRHALSRAQVHASTAVGLLLLAAAGCAGGLLLGGSLRWAMAAGYFATLTIPVSAAFGAPAGGRRAFLATCTLALAGVGAAYLLLPHTPGDPLPSRLFAGYVLGLFAFTWVSPALSLARGR